MKTKIIYISGSEIFDMADIRAAFDEVRAALGLTDTILFGVPVDMDNALPEHNMAPQAVMQVQTEPEVAESDVPQNLDAAPIPECEAVKEIIAEDDITPAAQENPADPIKKSRGRPRKAVIQEPVADSEPSVATATAPEAENTEAKVIPILSILSAKKAAAAAEVDELADEDDTEFVASDISDDISDEIVIEEELENTTDSEPEMDGGEAVVNAAIEIEQHIEIDEVTEVSIDDQIDEDVVQDADEEKTLEQLLESMAPLREDRTEHTADAEEIIVPTINDTDATLTQLATEFAENQDKITPAVQSETHGKIGKLKNILPFKKAKRDDNGLMGDLFGWAGIAANDDEFAMPGFFTTAASKK